MGDPVQDNLPRGGLRPLNCILLGIAVQENVQLRNLGGPTSVEFAVKLDCELHSHSLARTSGSTLRSAGWGHSPRCGLGARVVSPSNEGQWLRGRQSSSV